MEQKPSVLIADSNKENAKLVETYLKNDGSFEVVGCAYDGMEVLEMIKLCQPDVLILDLVLPNIDGLGVLERLHQSGKMPVVIVTGAFFQENVTQKCFALGANYYIAKPIDLQGLVKRINMFV